MLLLRRRATDRLAMTVQKNKKDTGLLEPMATDPGVRVGTDARERADPLRAVGTAKSG